MFGPLSRSGGTPARRLRRRVALIAVVGLVVALIVGEVIDEVVNSGHAVSVRSDASFVAGVGTVVVSSNALGPLFSAIRGAPADVVSRPNPKEALAELLDELTSGAASSQMAYADLGLVAPSTRAGQLFGVVLSDRLHAALSCSGAIALATSSAVGSGALLRAADELHGVGVELAASDVAYHAFERAVPAGSHAASLPASRLSVSEDWSVPATERFVAALSSSRVLAAHAAIRILAVSLTPPPVRIAGIAIPTPVTTTTTTTTTLVPSFVSGTSGLPLVVTTSTSTSTTKTISFGTSTTNQIPPPRSVSVIPATKTITVVAVIANAGNVPLGGIAIGASLRAAARTTPKAPGTRVIKHIESLTPGGARYIDLGELDVTSGASYVLEVTATAPSGASALDAITIQIG